MLTELDVYPTISKAKFLKLKCTSGMNFTFNSVPFFATIRQPPERVFIIYKDLYIIRSQM